MFRMWAYIPALAATCMLPLSAQDIFVTPGQSASTTIGVYRADPFSSAGSIAGPASAFQVLRAGASKLYVISRAAVDTVTVYEGTNQAASPTKRFSLNQPATAAAVSPDGRRVVVLAGSAYVFDTSNDTNVTSSGVAVGTDPSSVAISLDSSRAYVLSSTTQRLSAIDLATGTIATTTPVPGGGAEVGAAPNGFIYVAATNALFEYDARTLTNINTISLNAFPSRMSFTPDGRGALLVNTNPNTGSSLIHVDLNARTFVVAPPIGGSTVLNEVFAASGTTAYTFSSQTGRLYSTQLTPGGTAPLTLTPVNFGSIQVEDVRDIAISSEVPARYVYAISGVGIFRVDAAGSVAGPVPAPALGELSVAPVPVTTGATTVIALNATQSVAVDQTSRPLVVRVTDASNNPIGGAAVTFTANLQGATIVNAMAMTNNLGLATAQVTPPAATPSGTITVTATVAGIASAGAFTVNFGTGGGGSSSGTFEIVSGTGQVLGQFQTTANQEPLRVRARDASGRVLPGISVTWTVTQGQGGSLNPTVSTTDENGIATANFVSNFVSPGSPYVTSVISASTGTETATLYVTTVPNSGGNPGSLNAYRRDTPDPIEGRAGLTLPAAIKYDVLSPNGTRLPFVGIRVETDVKDAEGKNVAGCLGGTQLSDLGGVAACDLVVGPFVGETPITVTVGSVKVDRYTLIVRAGELSTLSIVQGNNQTGAPGTTLPQALIVQANDASGNRLPGVPIQWDNLTPTLATMTNRVDTTDVNGRASVNVVFGQNPGAVQIRARAGNASQTFSLTIGVPISSIRIEGGNNQNAAVSTPFAQALSVAVLNATGQPVQGVLVTFAVGSGSTGAVTLATPSATSNAQGIASTTVTAGSTTGPVTVTASSGAVSQNFNLTVRPPGPAFTAASILNGAGFQPGISPGSIAYIGVAGIVPNLRGTVAGTPSSGPLPTQLEGVEVLFNGIASPIFSVSNINGQESVNVQVPFEVAPGSASVTVRSTAGGSSTVTGVPILALKPGVFESVDAGGQRYAVAIRADGSYVSPANPARRGEIVTAFVTGLGQVSPTTSTNQSGMLNQRQNVLAPIIVGINNEGVRVVSAVLQPGVIGVYLVAFEVPANTTAGTGRPFAVAAVGTDGQAVFGNGTTMPIQ